MTKSTIVSRDTEESSALTAVANLSTSLVTKVCLSRGYFEIGGWRRVTLNEGLLCSLSKMFEQTELCWRDLIQSEVNKNTALYLSTSFLVTSLLHKWPKEQMQALNWFIEMNKRQGKYRIELSASEWLLFARAGVKELDLKSLEDGVDLHAVDIMQSIDGAEINGVIAVVKENDVPFLQREETADGFVWSYALHNL